MGVLSTILGDIPTKLLLTAIVLTSILIGLSNCGGAPPPTDNIEQQIEIEKITYCGDKSDAGKDQSRK